VVRRIAAGTIQRIRWRLWQGQVRRGLDLIAKTAVALEAAAETEAPATLAALKVMRRLGDLETYGCGQSVDQRSNCPLAGGAARSATADRVRTIVARCSAGIRFELHTTMLLPQVNCFTFQIDLNAYGKQ
jgi:hypothetical protein